MQKRRTGLRVENDNRSQKSHYTNVSKIGSIPSKNLELSLEVELDEEVRNIIRNPEKCPSALLDVTVIKPKGLDQYTTNTQTLKTDQIKKLIGSMKLDTKDKKLLMDKLFGVTINEPPKQKKNQKSNSLPTENKRKSCLSNKSKQVFRHSSVNLGNQGDVRCITDESSTAVYSMYNQVPHPKPQPVRQHHQPQPAPAKVQHIYTTPRTYENIRSMFACQDKERVEHQVEMDKPCLCQNCAIVGILTDSQKKPFATEPMPNPQEDKEAKYRRPSRKKSVSFKNLEELNTTNRSNDNSDAIFKLLSMRIGELERRVMLQEQKAVPKEYFKKIITKLVNHLSKLTHYTAEERNVPTTSHRDRDREYLAPNTPHTKFRSSGKYCVSPVMMENRYHPAEREYEPRPCSSDEPPRGASETLWRWGEEVLTSGRDLKNRVVVLLEETLKNLKKNWEKSQESRKCDEEIQCIVEELSKNLANSVRVSKSKSRERRRSRTPIRLAAKVRTPNTSLASRDSNFKQDLEKKTGKPSLIPRYKTAQVPVLNVAYVNPEMRRWTQESSVSFKIDDSDYDSHKGSMSESKKRQYKREFIKVLENTKTADKFKLWQNIWNQALENRQTKTDTVIIQIPDPKDLLRQKMIHLEYTIGELEELLLKDQNYRNS